MSFIVVHRFITTYKSSACPTYYPEGKLGTTFRVEAGGLVSYGTTTDTTVRLKRSLGAPCNKVEAGTREDLERTMGPPNSEVRAFACVLSALFGVCRRVSVSRLVRKVSP